MGRSESFKQYAADCVRQAAGEQRPEDKTILLNVALAWVRLAQQSQTAAANPAEPGLTAAPQPETAEQAAPAAA
jgi:hypothetical protein